MMSDLFVCFGNKSRIAVSVFQLLFVFAQTAYIFKFAKTYRHNFNPMSRLSLKADSAKKRFEDFSRRNNKRLMNKTREMF